MKYFAIALLFSTVAIFLSSCKKDNSNTSFGIEGSWELRRLTGSRPTTEYPAGNGTLLKFANTTYESYENGRLTKSGSFKIIEDPTVQSSVCLVVPADRYKSRIVYDNDDNSTKTFIQISNDTLSILRGCFAVDAGTNTEYVRRN